MGTMLMPPQRHRSIRNREFGRYVKYLREGLRLSTYELAPLARTSPSWITKIEGGSIPSDEILTSLAAALGTTYDDLADRAGINRPTDGSDAVVHVPNDDALRSRRRIAHLPAKAINFFLAQYDAASRSDDAEFRRALGLTDDESKP